MKKSKTPTKLNKKTSIPSTKNTTKISKNSNSIKADDSKQKTRNLTTLQNEFSVSGSNLEILPTLNQNFTNISDISNLNKKIKHYEVSTDFNDNIVNLKNNDERNFSKKSSKKSILNNYKEKNFDKKEINKRKEENHKSKNSNEYQNKNDNYGTQINEDINLLPTYINTNNSEPKNLVYIQEKNNSYNQNFLKENQTYSSNSLKQNILSLDLNSRTSSIINSINKNIHNINIDPVIKILSSSDILKSTFVKRLLEKITQSLQEERETYIVELLEANENLKKNLNDSQNRLIELENREIFLKQTLDETLISYDNDILERNEKINKLSITLERELKLKNEVINENKNIVDEFNSVKMNLDKLSDANSSLINSYKELKEEYDSRIQEINVFKKDNTILIKKLEESNNGLNESELKVNTLSELVNEKEIIIQNLVQNCRQLNEQFNNIKEVLFLFRNCKILTRI